MKNTSVNVVKWLVAVAIVLFLFPATAMAATPSAISQFGTTMSDVGYKVATDSNGNIFTAGDAGGTWQKITTTQYGFLRKTDSTGALQWQVPFQTSGAYTEIRGMALDADGNAFVCGSTNGNSLGGMDMFVAKVSPDGVVQWLDQEGTTLEDMAQGLCVDPSGNVYVVGWTMGSMNGVRNPVIYRDAVIIKFSNAGSRQWVRQYNFGNRPLNNFAYAIAYYDNEIFITGSVVGNVPGNLFLGVFDVATGTLQLQRNIGWENATGKAIAVNSNGIYIGGYVLNAFDGHTYYGGYRNGLLLGYDLSGNKTFSQTWAASVPYWDEASGIATASDGSVYVSANSRGNLAGVTSNGGFDAAILKFGYDGAYQSTSLLGTTSTEYGYGICLDQVDNYYVTGMTAYTFTGQKTSGGIDAFTSVFPTETSQALATITVKEQSTSAPMVGVYATVSDVNNNLVETVYSDNTGKFKIRTKAGKVHIWKNKHGYVPLAAPEEITINPGCGTNNQFVSLMKKANTPPVAVVYAPAGGRFAQGLAVTFSGAASDPEDGALTGASLAWYSNVNGKIGTGAVCSSSALSVGTHTITLIATDSAGATAQATSSVTIYATGTSKVTATITVLNQATGKPIPNALVSLEDKDGNLLAEATTNSAGIVIVNLDKAGKVWMYKDAAGYTSVVDPDVQVINTGAKNSITTYMK